MELLGGALKAGVPMEEEKLIPGTPEAAGHKQPADISISDHSKPSTVPYNTVSTSLMPTSKTTEELLTGQQKFLLATVSSPKEMMFLQVVPHCLLVWIPLM